MMPTQEAFEAYRDGQITLDAFIGERHDPVWGTSVYQRSGSTVLLSAGNPPSGIPPGGTSGASPSRSSGGPIPVSQALSIPTTAGYYRVRDAVDAIDRVHTDGSLPTIAVRRTPLKGTTQGQYSFVAPFDIDLDPNGVTPRMTVAHEVGHFLDHHGIGGGANPVVGGILRFPSSIDPAFAGWRQSVMRSKAYTTLVGIQARIINPDAQRYIGYLLDPHELWARSYAQFIATRSGSSVMGKELNRLRTSAPNTVYLPTQWEDGDFAAITDEIEQMFRLKGWMP